MNNVILLLCGFLGVFCDCCMKAQGLKTKAKVGNISFKIKDYLADDYISIAFAFASIFVWLLIFGEVSTRYPQVIGYTRLSFVLFGGVGSHAIQYFFSVADKKIMNIIDKKTDIADNK